MSVRVVNKLPQFASANSIVMDRVLSNTATEGLRLSVMQAPHLHGALWRSGKTTRKSLMSYEVSYHTPYSRKWHYETPRRGFSHPGAKNYYLKDPLDLVTSPARMNAKFKAAGSSIRI